MKIIYYSHTFFTDCDFPLVKALQELKIDVRYYLPLKWNFQNGCLLDLERPIKKWGIYKASNIKEMQAYKGCLDLNRLYLICGVVNRCWFPFSWLLYLFVILHMCFQRAEVFHFTWQFNCFERLFLRLHFKRKVMTVHDPVQHSGLKNHDQKEIARKRCFEWADCFVLLNKQQIGVFSNIYGIAKNRILLSHLGAYDSIAHMKLYEQKVLARPYIIFFGQITPHKGLEYLFEAMKQVHKVCPDINLLVAGSGKIYFDIEKYKDLDCIIMENRYIGLRELVNMVKGCLFVVCPYKDATQSGVIQTALALNTPVVATDVGALPSMVQDGVYGKIVKACDSESLGNAICELVKSPKTLDEMRNKIHEEWLKTMSWTPIAETYVSFYLRNGGIEQSDTSN